MTVAERLGQDLAAARRRGEPFESAWPVAVEHALVGQRGDERAQWRAALADTRPAWLAAFERRPATRAQRAVLALAPDPDAMPAQCRRDAARPPIRERIAA
jgi:hypothetical protein